MGGMAVEDLYMGVEEHGVADDQVVEAWRLRVLYDTVTECAHRGHLYLSHITCVCN